MYIQYSHTNDLCGKCLVHHEIDGVFLPHVPTYTKHGVFKLGYALKPRFTSPNKSRVLDIISYHLSYITFRISYIIHHASYIIYHIISSHLISPHLISSLISYHSCYHYIGMGCPKPRVHQLARGITGVSPTRIYPKSGAGSNTSK